MSINSLGRYRIIREIARSNDVVYEAVDAAINRRVALKELLLPPNLTGAARKERIDRFYREARAAGSLSHPNIVTIFEAGEDHGRHFIAMEYLEGQTLRNVLETEGKLPEERAVEITRQVCDALTYAHARSVVHRDIKPDNIQILPTGKVKITDFGIARIMEEPSLTADGQVFGTPSYMSPEQVAGKDLDHRTDIFSLGIVLFEMLTGRKPFQGDSVVTITYNIMNQDVITPTTAPPYLEQTIRKALQKDPGMRYATVAEMAADLDPSRAVDPTTYYQAAPSNVTISGPSPFPSQPAPPPQAPDPLGGLKPGDLSLPPLPSRPLLSDEARYFLKVMLAVMAVCGFIIGFIWVLNSGYQGYQRTVKIEQVNAHIQAGESYLNQQSYQAAAQEFSLALTLTEDEKQKRQLGNVIASCYVHLGDQARAQNRMDTAINWWTEALNIDRHNSAALDRIAGIYLQRGNAYAQSGDLTTALQWWQKAQDTSPGTQSGIQAGNNIQRYLLEGL